MADTKASVERELTAHMLKCEKCKAAHDKLDMCDIGRSVYSRLMETYRAEGGVR